MSGLQLDGHRQAIFLRTISNVTKRMFDAAIFVIGIGTAQSVCQTTDAAAVTAKVRIGTYDNRSIAVAFAASRHNPVKEKMAAYERAKAAGDRKTIKELEAWGEHHQRLLHFQGFGRVPVSDLLEPVKERVRELARRRGLAAICMKFDYIAADVEVVDITEELVKLDDPSAKTLSTARGVRSAKPTDLDQLGKLPAKL